MKRCDAMSLAWKMTIEMVEGLGWSGWPWDGLEPEDARRFVDSKGDFTSEGAQVKAALDDVVACMKRAAKPRSRGRS